MKTSKITKLGLLLAFTFITQSALAFYNPQTGRWLSRDPIGEDGGKNVFIFTNNKTPNEQDYLGLKLNVPDPIIDFDPSIPGPYGKTKPITDFILLLNQGSCFNPSGIKIADVTASVQIMIYYDTPETQNRIIDSGSMTYSQHEMLHFQAWKGSAEGFYNEFLGYIDTCYCGITCKSALEAYRDTAQFYWVNLVELNNCRIDESEAVGAEKRKQAKECRKWARVVQKAEEEKSKAVKRFSESCYACCE